MRRGLLAGVAAAAVLLGVFATPGAASPRGCRSADWPMYGRDNARTFSVPAGCSSITKSNVFSLVPAWFFHAKDSVTATPSVSHGTVYVGSWDGTFYALDAQNGALRWKFQISTHAASAFGRIVSTAAVVTAGRGADRRRVVIFGGGSAVWVLDAATGRELASLDIDPRKPKDRHDAANPRVVEIESSPAVVPADHGRQRIYVGMDVHDESHVGRTGLVALTLVPGHRWKLRPQWKYDPETGRTYGGRPGLTRGSGEGLGCGGIWSSPTVDVARRLVIIGVASCDYGATALARHVNYSEEMVGLDLRSGHERWRFRPSSGLSRAQRIKEAYDDADFGATPNIFQLRDGEWVVGDGSKNANYYVRDERTGSPVSTTLAGEPGRLNENFAVGGFIGSSGVQVGADGRALRVIGGTAIPLPKALTLADIDRMTWFIRAIDPQRGTVDWTYRLGAPTYGATSVANGIAFVPLTTESDVVALDAATGKLLWLGPVVGPPSSGAAIVGDSIYVGTGTRETDLEYKAISDSLQNALKDSVGESPLSPISGVQAFRLAADVLR